MPCGSKPTRQLRCHLLVLSRRRRRTRRQRRRRRQKAARQATHTDMPTQAAYYLQQHVLLTSMACSCLIEGSGQDIASRFSITARSIKCCNQGLWLGGALQCCVCLRPSFVRSLNNLMLNSWYVGLCITIFGSRDTTTMLFMPGMAQACESRAGFRLVS